MIRRLRRAVAHFGAVALPFAQEHAWDLTAAAGLLMIFAGLWAIYWPAALVVVGGLVLTFGLWASRAQAAPDAKQRESNVED